MKYEVVRFWDDGEDEQVIGYVNSYDEYTALINEDLGKIGPFGREHVHYKMMTVKNDKAS